MHMTEFDLAQWAARKATKRENDIFETALAAIMAVLNADGIAGRNDWHRYAAAGEWS